MAKPAPLAGTNANLAFADALLRALVAGGVRDLCLCPGSRSAPLAAAAVEVPGLRRLVHVDERSAGFFALGLARARRGPVALLCTSGTAALGFAPSVVEASLARVPLVVLSADRPPELRGWGAPQTIEQVHVYGRHVRFFADAPPPSSSAPRLDLARALAERAVHEARGGAGGGAGPVHLNLPFREPLHPVSEPLAAPEPSRPPAPARRRALADVSIPARRLAEIAGGARRGLVVCGPEDGDPELPEAAAFFARRAGWPVLAEVTSQLRFGPHTQGGPILAGGEALLGCAGFAARCAPDVVLRTGAAPTGRRLACLADAHPEARLVAVDADGGSRDPSHRVDEWLHAPAGALLRAAAGLLSGGRGAADPGWLPAFFSAEKRAAQALDARLTAAETLCGPAVARLVFEALPPGATLYLSNSAPVRDAELALPVSAKPVRVLANRGANGIDGVLSSALGASLAAAPLVLLIGDLAFLHDVSGLFAARRHGLRATVVVANDAGGGIFDRLPIAAAGERVAYDELFRCSHDLRAAPIARAYGCAGHEVRDAAALERALRVCLTGDGVQVIEVLLSGTASEDGRRAAQAAVAAAVDAP